MTRETIPSARYLLTLKKEDEVYKILIDGGFTHRPGCGSGAFSFEDIGEVRYYPEGIDALDMRVPTISGCDCRGGLHLHIAYACADAGLKLPETRIWVPGDVMMHLLELPDSKALRTLKMTEPFAVYDPKTDSLDTRTLQRIQNSRCTIPRIIIRAVFG